MAINMTLVEGYLTSEPQQCYTNSGDPYISFRLGCHRDRAGKKQAYDFVSFRAYRALMDNILKYVSVGQCITVRAANKSFIRKTPGKEYPMEFKEVEKVYFNKRAAAPKELDPKRQEIELIMENYDGFDEDGLFPKEDKNE